MFELVAGALLETLLGEAVGVLAGRAKQAKLSRDEKKHLQRIGREVAAEMQPLFEYETAGWADNDVESVITEAALALTRVPLTAEALIADNLDPALLTQRLREGYVPTGFSPNQRAVYERLLAGTSEAIMRVAVEVAGYEVERDKALLTGQDAIYREQAATMKAIVELIRRDERDADETEERYRQAVRILLDRMELFGVPEVDPLHRHQSLSVSFITLRVERKGKKSVPVVSGTTPWNTPITPRVSGKSKEKTDKEEEKQGYQRENLGVSSLSAPQLQRRAAQLSGPADEMLAGRKRAVLIGKPGSGKTTLLRWLAVRAASRDCPVVLSDWNDLVPFFIRLREHVETGFPLPATFPNLVAPELHFPDGWPEHLLKTGRALVLIDGVDELPLDKRGAMLDGLARLVTSYPSARYLITSRPTALKEWQAWQDWMGLAQVQEVALQEMDTGQIEAFVDHWFHAVEQIPTLAPTDRVALPALSTQLKTQLRQRRVLRQLATTPLLCAMLCALFRQRQEVLPAERITLYHQCCHMLLSGREEVRKIALGSEYPKLSDLQRWSLLRTFACWLLRNGLSEVETERAAERFSAQLTRFGWVGTGEGARAYFVERTGLLTEPIESTEGRDGTVSFTHRTFQEFLAAQQLVEEDSQEELLGHATEDDWRETIILAAGLGSERWRESLLVKLLERANAAHTGDTSRPYHLLALACLETAQGAGVVKTLQMRVQDAAKAYFPPEDMVEAELLAKAGEEAIPFLRSTSSRSDQMAAACVRALTLIGGEGAMRALADYAKASNAYWIGSSLVSELGQSWDAFDHEQYALIVLIHCKALRLSGVTELKPLQLLTDLRQLDLRQSMVSDLTPLQSITSLRELYLSTTQLHLVPEWLEKRGIIRVVG